MNCILTPDFWQDIRPNRMFHLCLTYISLFSYSWIFMSFIQRTMSTYSQFLFLVGFKKHLHSIFFGICVLIGIYSYTLIKITWAKIVCPNFKFKNDKVLISTQLSNLDDPFFLWPIPLGWLKAMYIRESRWVSNANVVCT